MLVAEVLKSGTVKIVGATLGDDVDHGAQVAAILSGEVVGDDLEFLHLILVVDKKARAADAEVIVIRTIDLEVI